MNINNVIQIVSLVIAVVTVVSGFVAIALARKQNQLTLGMKPIKQLTVIHESYAPLIQTDKSLLGNVKVNYKKKTVKNLVNLRLRITNSGNQPIKPDDYYLPITFSVRGLFLDAYQASENNRSFDFLPEIKTPIDTIVCKELLLNPKESISISFTVTEEDDDSAKRSLSVDGKLIDGEVVFVKLDRDNNDSQVITTEQKDNLESSLVHLSNISDLLTLILFWLTSFSFTYVILQLPSF